MSCARRPFSPTRRLPMTPSRAVALLLLIAAPAAAQVRTGKVLPNQIAVGPVYMGATVEASFQVFERGTDDKLPLQVTAPKFVKVLRKAVRTQQYGPGNDFVCGSVEIAIDTRAAGLQKGEVQVTLGQTTVKVPVSATVKRRRPGLARLLVAETPFEKYTTEDGRAFKPWTDLVEGASLDAHYLLLGQGKPVLRDLDLSKFDCVLLASVGLTQLTPADL